MKKITLMIFVSLLSFCGYSQLALEGFDATFPPTGWEIYNESGPAVTWAQATGSAVQPAFAGLHAAYLNKENVASGLPTDWLVTPVFNVPANGELRFYSRLTQAGDQGSVYKVMIADADDLSGSPLVAADYAEFAEMQPAWTELTLNPVQTDYIEKIVPIPAGYTGNVRIAFVMQGDDGDRWLVDNVKVVSQCMPVTNLTASGMTLTSANLNWTNPVGGATEWEVEVVLDTDTPSGTGVEYSGALPYVATETATGVDFTENTNYKYYVRALCSDGGVSAWAGPFFFSTVSLGESCNAPIVISALPYSDTDDTGNFSDVYEGSPGASGCGSTNGYLNGNDVVYSFPATTTGTISIDVTGNGAYSGVFIYTSCANIGVNCSGGATTGATPAALSIPTFAVTAGTTYYIVISTWATPQTTPYTLSIQQVFCTKPVGLPTTNIGMTSADLSWTNPSSATSWEVYVQTPGAGLPVGAGVTANTNTNYTATAQANGTALAASTAYEYYVRANCGDGNFSAWAGPYLFNTTICATSEQCNYTFTVIDSWGDGWNGNTMTVSQNGITIGTLGLAAGTGPVAITIPVCNNLPIQLFWNAGGNFANEVGVSITNSFGQVFYNKPPGTGSANTVLYSGTVDCLNPMCLPPSGLTVTGITPTTANLGWAGPATGTWDVYVVPTGSAAPTAATPGTEVTTNPYTATSLTPDATYQFYVRLVCDASSNSTWAGPFSFTMLPTCPKPLNLTATAIGDTEATLGWTEANTATNWEVYLVVNGSPAPTAATDGTPTTSNPYTPTTLTSGTVYQYWVKAICGPGDESLWSGPYTFTTTICDPVDQCTYNFIMTDSWGDGWNGNTMTVSQNGVTIATIGSTFTTGLGPVTIPVQLCTGEPFLLHWNTGGAFANEVGVSIQNSFSQIIFTKPSGTGTVGTDLYTSVADCLVPMCLPPTALTATGITIDSAILGWTAPASTAWEVYVVPTGDPAPTAATDGVDAATNPFTYDQAPLVPDSTFDYYVRVVCSPTSSSLWAGPFTFTTLPTCPKPINLTATNISDTQVDLGWTETGLATAWEVYVVENGDPAPVAATEGVDAATNPYTYDELTPGVMYQYYVRAVCAEDDKSKWSGPYAFNTAVCPLADQCAYTFTMWDSFGDSWNGNTMTISQNGIPVATLTGPADADNQTPITQVVNLCSGVPFLLHWNAGGAFATEVGVSITNFYDEVIYTKAPGAGSQNSDLYTGLPVCSPITCPQPTDLTSAGFDLTSVILSWTAGAAETQWEVVVQDAGGPYPGNDPATSAIVNEATYHAEDLVEGEFYEYYVRAVCGPDDVSFWSGPMAFNIFNPSGCNIEVVDIGNPDIGTIVNGTEYVICPEDDNCVNLSATYLETGDTSTYDIESIDYAPPYPFTGGTPVSVGTDDVWSPVYDLPFDFCFYGNNYSSVIVGSNGVVSFDTSDASGYCPWAFTQQIPNPGFPILNAIYGVYQDIYPPTVNDFAQPDVNVQVLGNYPCRALVVNYSEVAQFSACGTDPAVGAQTTQIVLYEVTNVIEIYVGRRVPCTTWQAGAGVLGIQNADGTAAAVPTGRNTGPWTAIEEAWRFIPDGESNTTFAWLQDGVVVSTDTDIEVCVTDQAVMTARATYTDCNGDEIVKESELTITIADPIETEDPLDLTQCSTGEEVTFDLTDALVGMVADPENYVFTFYATEAAAIAGLTDNLDPTHATNASQTIYVRIVKNGLPCFVTASFELILNNIPPQFTVTNDFSICEGGPGNTITVTPGNFNVADATYSWTLDNNPLPDTTNTITATEGGVYEVTVTKTGCVGTDTVTVTAVPVPVADAPADVTACDSYQLPELTVGNYFTGAGGTGTQLFANEVIDGSQTLYVYAESGTTPNCTNENSFTITINTSPVVTTPGDQSACESYALPALTVGNYFTGPAGSGVQMYEDDLITESQLVYVYAETGTVPNCTDEASFNVTITPIPVADAPDDVTVCDSYVLPELSEGNSYFTEPGGAGTQLMANSTVNQTQVIYVYAQSGTTPNCTDENSFTVNITATPAFSLGGPYVACDATDITVTVTPSNFNAGDASFAWTINGVATGDTGSSVDATAFGTYAVTVTVGDCSHTESIEVTENTIQIAALATDFCEDNVYMLEVTDVDGSFEPASSTYVWTNATGATVATTQEFAVPAKGMYTVTVTTADNCTGTASFDVIDTSCDIQRGISPNEDGLNDNFDLTTLDVSHIGIFNRYGQEVYSHGTYTNQWHGQGSNGDELPTGTYFYMIERSNGEQITGWIYINREE
jgi:gliding motility-associated-like protein